jgi:uncharacterized repeat protein (TIGR01451 family)
MRRYALRSRAFSLFACLSALLGFAVIAAAPPVNDQCGGAEVVTPAGPFPYLTAVTDLTDATTTGDPTSSTCADLPSLSRSVWYKFIPSTTALYTFSSCQDAPTGTTVPDTAIDVYTGTCGSSFSEVLNGCDEDSCGVSDLQAVSRNVQLFSGTTYWIVVWKFGAAPPASGQSSVQLRITQDLTPANDTCSNPTPLALNGVGYGTNSLAGLNYSIASPTATCYPGVGQSTPQNAAAGPDTVWTFTPPTTDTYSLKAQVTLGSGSLVLYTSPTCPSPGTLTCDASLVAANRNSLSTNWVSAEEVVCQSLTAGTPVYAFVDQTETFLNITGYTIEASRCVKEAEPNNTPAQAGPLACPVTGSIGVIGDQDFYALGAPPSGSSVFAMVDGVPAGPNNRFDMRVTTAADTLEYDSGNNSPAFGDFSSNVAGTRLTGAASYLKINYNGDATAAEPYRLYAVVQPPGGGAGGTSATLESEPNNTIANANAAGNMFFSGTTTGSDLDMFRFCAAQGDLIAMGMDGSPLRNGVTFNPALFLFDEDGGKLINADYTLGGTYYLDDTAFTASTASGSGLTATTPFSPGESATWRARYTGVYFAGARGGVSGSGSSNGDYLLSIAVNCQAGSQQSAPLSVTGNDTPDPVEPGGTISYTITLNNAGPNIALDAVLSDPLPAGTTFVAVAAPAGWSCTTPAVGANGTVSCTTACFPPGSAPFTLQVKVNACQASGTVLTNTATPSSKTVGAATAGAQTTLVTCDDANPCTDDTCNPAGGCLHANNSASCDDGNPCTTGDACVAGVCAGVTAPPPAEVHGVQVSRSQQTAGIVWDAAADATRYDVLRGPLDSLPVGAHPGAESCLGNDLQAPAVADPDPLADGAGFWYLVRSESACGNGSYGYQADHGSPTIERTSPTCP